MDKEQISALLGRPLTSIEDTNFSTYLNLATENLETLICTPVSEVSETRTFDTRKEYKTAFVDIFWNIESVTLDGETVESSDYSIRQWDKRNASWYNSLVFEEYLDGEVLEVTADWGFEPVSDASSLPIDLQSVLAGLFGLISKKNKADGTITQKQVEDFRIHFNTEVDIDQEFYDKYRGTLNKYSLCHIPNVVQGDLGC